jgi:hypothetical protein
MEDLEPSSASEPPFGALSIEALDPRYNACSNLVGWDEGA